MYGLRNPGLPAAQISGPMALGLEGITGPTQLGRLAPARHKPGHELTICCPVDTVDV